MPNHLQVGGEGSAMRKAGAFVFSETGYSDATVGSWFTVLFNVKEVPCLHKNQETVYSPLAGEAVECCRDLKGDVIFRIKSMTGDFDFRGRDLAKAGVPLQLRRPPPVRVCTK